MGILILDERPSKLIGTRCAVAASYSAQKPYHLVYIASDGELGNALSVAGAAVNKLQRRDLMVFDVENYLFRAGSACFIRFHMHLIQ